VAQTALARSVRNLAEIAGSRSIRKPCASVLLGSNFGLGSAVRGSAQSG